MDEKFEGFDVIDVSKNTPKMTVSSRGVMFGMGVADALGNPGYWQILVNDKTKEVAVRAAEADTPGAFRFSVGTKPSGGLRQFRICKQILISRLQMAAGCEDRMSKFSVVGKYVPHAKTVLFDLSKVNVYSGGGES